MTNLNLTIKSSYIKQFWKRFGYMIFKYGERLLIPVSSLYWGHNKKNFRTQNGALWYILEKNGNFYRNLEISLHSKKWISQSPWKRIIKLENHTNAHAKHLFNPKRKLGFKKPIYHFATTRTVWTLVLSWSGTNLMF